MKSLQKIKILLVLLLIIPTSVIFSQGIMISDDGQTVADPSAVLEIQSNSKGLLIPRLTTSQRNSLTSSAKEGLLVYDSDLGSFFIFGKTSTGSLNWNDLSTPSGIWRTNSNDVYLANPYSNVGIGTSSPSKKLVIKAQNDNDTLFEILDKDDKPLMIITPSLTKIFFNQTTKATAGGFAVGRYATAKSKDETSVFLVTPDSTRVYTTASSTKATAGGFAVGRYATAKGGFAKKYFYTGIDSTRVYTDGNNPKATAGGFAVGRYATAKGSNGNYMYMVPNNYFIGHNSGSALQNSSYTGKFNTFFGYQTGLKDTSGGDNVFIGYQSGLNNTSGEKNIFIGVESGFQNTSGSKNVFLGYQTGYLNTTGFNNVYIGNNAARNGTGSQNVIIGDNAGYKNTTNQNVFIGERSGTENTSGSRNVFLGFWSGASNVTGMQNTYIGGFAGNDNLGEFNTFVGYWAGGANVNGENNVFIGRRAGVSTSGSNNVFIGHRAGEGASGSNKLYIANAQGTPLIYGEFDNDFLKINGSIGVGIDPEYKLDVYDNSPNWAARIYNNGNQISRLGLKIQAGTDDNSGTNYMIGFYDGDDTYLGSITSNGGTISYGTKSPKSTQKNVTPFTKNANELIKNIRIVSYKDKANVLRTEFLGDNMLEIIPASTIYDKDKNEYLIDKSSLMPVVIKAIQDQQKELESLKEQKTRIRELERQIEELKVIIQQKN